MKILVDLTSLADNFSGIERFALNITKNMIEVSGHQFVLLFKREVHPAFTGLTDRCEMVAIPECNKLLFNQIRLPRALSRFDTDWYLFPAFPAPWISRKRKYISAIHDVGCWDCPETMKFLQRQYFRFSYRIAARKSRTILTVSEFSKKRISETIGIDSDNIHVIHNGIEECFFNSQLDAQFNAFGVPGNENYILSLCTIEPRKNLRLLIKAYDECINADELSNKLVLAGRTGWKVSNLLEGISEKTRSKIHITGFIPDEELPQLYRNAELFVFPSLYEGFGIPPLEAMACGTPVLSSDAASMPEILGETAEYFRSGDCESLRKKMIAMLKSGRSKEKVQLGKNTAGKYSWRTSAKRLIEIMETLN